MPKIVFEESTHTYTVDGRVVPSVTQILAKAGLVADYNGIPPATLAYARDRGSHVDQCCDLLDADDLDWTSIHPDCVGYVRAWAAFRDAERFTSMHVQGVVYHAELDYCGTFDGYGLWSPGYTRQEPTIVDRKCTSKLSDTYGIQLAGYAMPGIAFEGTLPLTVARRIVVQLRPDGTYRLAEYTRAADFDAFRAACVIAKWRNGNG